MEVLVVLGKGTLLLSLAFMIATIAYLLLANWD